VLFFFFFPLFSLFFPLFQLIRLATLSFSSFFSFLLLTNHFFHLFLKRIVDTWNKIIDLIQDSYIYDEFLIPTLVQWFSTISTSHVRSLRHTCTFVSLKIISKLCVIISKVSNNLEISLSQKRKKGTKKDGAADNLSNHQTFLKEQINALYTGSLLFFFSSHLRPFLLF